tara:strand:+ start:67 stop:333 length:267 start_codon:yes stop_codon:yes gene_type:complete
MCECLRLEPNKLNKKTKIFTPRIVYKLTTSPKRKTKEEILIACVKELLNEKIIPSNGCVLKTVMGVKTVAEWWTLCNAHKIGHLCIHR